MNTKLAAVCQHIANRGYTAAIVGPNEIQTDAPENICRDAVEFYAPVEADQLYSAIRRRKRRTARSASPATAPKRRRRTKRRAAKPKTIRRTTRRRKHHARKTSPTMIRPTKTIRRRRHTRRRGKTWTAAMRAAFAAKMKAARAFYKKAKR